MPPSGSPADRERLEHMLAAARDAVSIAVGRRREELDSDVLLRHALVRCVQLIGEAATRVGEAAKARAPGLPWARIVGMDVSLRLLKIASERLRLDRLPPMQRRRIELMHGSLMCRDARLAGFDAATCVEVVEHLDPPRLAAFERVLLEFARPQTIVLTTPNCEYNVKFETLPAGRLRHRDHRFEWARSEFETWANGLANRFGYAVRFLPVGPTDSAVGAPTQMAVFDDDKKENK